jgi:polyisoprenoid-binding protein YceI
VELAKKGTTALNCLTKEMKTKLLPLQFAAFTTVFLAACSNPADKVPAAQVSSGTNAPTIAKTDSAQSARTYVIRPDNSKIEFIGSKVTGSHSGGFTNFIGEIKVTDGKLAGSGNRVVIDTTSLWSDNGRLTGHLKNPDFFDVQKYPTALFENFSVVSGAGTNSTISGNLTLHGITKQVSFPANVQIAEDKVIANAEFKINRFDFEMKYPGKADDLIRQEVVLKLAVSATPGTADFKPLEKPPTAPSSAGQ